MLIPARERLRRTLGDEIAGNGVVTNRTFDQNRGFVTAVAAGVSNAVANLSFTFDAIGNLVARGDAVSGVFETFTYG